MGMARAIVERLAIGVAYREARAVIAWHRKGFRLYWKWKSRHREGRPSVSVEVIDLIRRMSLANPGWGAPRIHGELLKLVVCPVYNFTEQPPSFFPWAGWIPV